MRDKRIFARRRFDHRATSAHGQRAMAGHRWRNGLRTTTPIGHATCATIVRPARNEVRTAAGHGRQPCEASAQGAWLQPESQGDWLFTVGGGRLRLIKSTTRSKVPSSFKDPSLGSDTTVGKPWRIRIPSPDGTAAFLGVLPCWRLGAWLQPESQGDWLFTVGGGRLRLIKSTTRSKVPSSACTRRPDEISTDGNSERRRQWWWSAAAALREEGRPRALGLGLVLVSSDIQPRETNVPSWG
ncbi:hypothetical protein F511_10941 [Dorcoceras hygrometricum]|uniref:Uncharacterized protein n=1 Tax=Dorcoceras hygrometricum TaxID=472368 RepID=A0A2Z7BRW6_9LAMI|nr:hypothetical protein F511_10941 [Dorcoceras hygrometricum]